MRAENGRFGDDMLVHLGGHEIAGLEAILGRKLPENPVDGGKELFILPAIAAGLSAFAGTGVGAATTAGTLAAMGSTALSSAPAWAGIAADAAVGGLLGGSKGAITGGLIGALGENGGALSGLFGSDSAGTQAQVPTSPDNPDVFPNPDGSAPTARTAGVDAPSEKPGMGVGDLMTMLAALTSAGKDGGNSRAAARDDEYRKSRDQYERYNANAVMQRAGGIYQPRRAQQFAEGGVVDDPYGRNAFSDKFAEYERRQEALYGPAGMGTSLGAGSYNPGSRMLDMGDGAYMMNPMFNPGYGAEPEPEAPPPEVAPPVAPPPQQIPGETVIPTNVPPMPGNAPANAQYQEYSQLAPAWEPDPNLYQLGSPMPAGKPGAEVYAPNASQGDAMYTDYGYDDYGQPIYPKVLDAPPTWNMEALQGIGVNPPTGQYNHDIRQFNGAQVAALPAPTAISQSAGFADGGVVRSDDYPGDLMVRRGNLDAQGELMTDVFAQERAMRGAEGPESRAAMEEYIRQAEQYHPDDGYWEERRKAEMLQQLLSIPGLIDKAPPGYAEGGVIAPNQTPVQQQFAVNSMAPQQQQMQQPMQQMQQPMQQQMGPPGTFANQLNVPMQMQGANMSAPGYGAETNPFTPEQSGMTVGPPSPPGVDNIQAGILNANGTVGDAMLRPNELVTSQEDLNVIGDGSHALGVARVKALKEDNDRARRGRSGAPLGFRDAMSQIERTV